MLRGYNGIADGRTERHRMMRDELETTISGIPCKVVVTGFSAPVPGNRNLDPMDDPLSPLPCPRRNQRRRGMSNRTKHDECYACKHKRSVPGNAHIRCVNPDPDMKGHAVGLAGGWFIYPILFDPTWKERDCQNFEPAGDSE